MLEGIVWKVLLQVRPASLLLSVTVGFLTGAMHPVAATPIGETPGLARVR
jgi:hypothetical protein